MYHCVWWEIRGQICGVKFLPSTCTWVLRLELRSLGLHLSVYLLSHITGSCFGGLRQCLTRQHRLTQKS